MGSRTRIRSPRVGALRMAVLGVTALAAVVLGASGTVNAATRPAKAVTTAASALTPTSFNRNFSAMVRLRSLVKEGKGGITAILPDTVSSARYTEFDAPFLTTAMMTADLPAADITVENAEGVDATELSDAEAAVTAGSKVIIMDPLDSGVGAAIETYAKSHGVDVIDYDRLTLGGSREYYVSFNNVKVGTLIGKGFVACAAAWHVKKPEVMVMHGATTDNNATLFAQGYDKVLAPYFKDGKYVDVANTAGTWTPSDALTEFQQAYTAHSNINSAVIPNDETGAPIISYLQSLHIKPKTFPTTGQDATLVGLQNVLSGYQCGTVYKPIYEEAQAAVALAIYLRAGKTPPASLVNSTTEDTVNNVAVPSVLLKPEWVTTKNMNSTVIADDFVPAYELCASPFSKDCKAAGIKP
ncbi:MAG: substrate-binding domain-containing protein [Candidatus Dormiibacterota bacterium]